MEQLRYCGDWGRFGIMVLYLDSVFDPLSVMTEEMIVL